MCLNPMKGILYFWGFIPLYWKIFLQMTNSLHDSEEKHFLPQEENINWFQDRKHVTRKLAILLGKQENH